MTNKHLSVEAQTILNLAKEFARQDGQNYVGTEHLLLGLLGDCDGLAAKLLEELSVDLDRAKEQVDILLKSRSQETWVMGRLPGTPNFRNVLDRASEQAKGASNWQIRSEHLLLALLADRGSTGCKALEAMGVGLDTVRRAIIRSRAPDSTRQIAAT